MVDVGDEEVECLMGCLANLQREDECFQELIGKAKSTGESVGTQFDF